MHTYRTLYLLPQILLSYALEGTDRVQRTSLDVLLSFTGAFTLVTLGGESHDQLRLVPLMITVTVYEIVTQA